MGPATFQNSISFFNLKVELTALHSFLFEDHDVLAFSSLLNFFRLRRLLKLFLGIMQFFDVVYKVRIRQASSENPAKAVVSKVASQLNMEQRNHKHILKGITGSIGPGEILASGSGKTTLLKILGGRLHENVRGTITYNDIPYSPALKRRLYLHHFFSLILF